MHLAFLKPINKLDESWTKSMRLFLLKKILVVVYFPNGDGQMPTSAWSVCSNIRQHRQDLRLHILIIFLTSHHCVKTQHCLQVFRHDLLLSSSVLCFSHQIRLQNIADIDKTRYSKPIIWKVILLGLIVRCMFWAWLADQVCHFCSSARLLEF